MVVSVPVPPEDVRSVVDTLIGVICEEMGFTLQRSTPQPSATASKPTANWYYIQVDAAAEPELNQPANTSPTLVLDGHSSIDTSAGLQQYLDLGVPEVWCVDGQVLHFYQLDHGSYVESDRSTTFPFIPVAEIPMFVEKVQKVGEPTVAKAFRAWSRMRIRENRGQSNPPPPPLPPLNPFQ